MQTIFICITTFDLHKKPVGQREESGNKSIPIFIDEESQPHSGIKSPSGRDRMRSSLPTPGHGLFLLWRPVPRDVFFFRSIWSLGPRALGLLLFLLENSVVRMQ